MLNWLWWVLSKINLFLPLLSFIRKNKPTTSNIYIEHQINYVNTSRNQSKSERITWESWLPFLLFLISVSILGLVRLKFPIPSSIGLLFLDAWVLQDWLFRAMDSLSADRITSVTIALLLTLVSIAIIFIHVLLMLKENSIVASVNSWSLLYSKIGPLSDFSNLQLLYGAILPTFITFLLGIILHFRVNIRRDIEALIAIIVFCIFMM